MADARKVRVMVVDDSVVIRRILCDVISTDSTLEVVGTADNGAIALTKLPQLNPDLITLDVEMPVMDGLATLVAIRKQFPRLPVIMFSTLTQRGTAATIDALTRGASDYVTKPANVGSFGEARQAIIDQLIPKIRSLCHRPTSPSRSGTGTPGSASGADSTPPMSGIRSLASPPASGIRSIPPLSGVRSPSQPSSGVRTLPLASSARPALPKRATNRRIDVVVIGISTGGPNALVQLLPSLPADLPVPLLIVQHMPPTFTTLLAERLAKTTRFPVKEATGGERVGSKQAWLAPGGYHLEVVPTIPGWSLRLQTDPSENSCRPAADVLFRSAASSFGPGVLGVVMTGMGQDGQKGCEAIRAAGGQVIVQDEATSVVWGMPGSVVRAGLADKVLPLEQLAGEIVQRTRFGREPA